MRSAGRSAARARDKEERRRTRCCRAADRVARAEAARLLRQPETRAGVRAFHARSRDAAMPYDPGMDAAMRDRPESPWARADALSKAQSLARKEEARAAARRERQDRRQEDRAGLRPFEACKRARQEAYSIPYVPPEFGPTAAPAQRRQPAREAPGGLAARQRGLARRRRPA